MLVALAAALTFASVAQAATVTPERGEVLLNRGKGFAPVLEPAQAAPGDQVMAGPSSAGRVAFEDGCIVTVRPGAILTIASTSPCERSSGSHVETGGSLKDGPFEQPAADGRREALPFVAAFGVAAGFVLAPTRDRAASP
jgi:hypothetical protein